MNANEKILLGLACDHTDMSECHVGCGHWSCPCGISFDEGAACDPVYLGEFEDDPPPSWRAA